MIELLLDLPDVGVLLGQVIDSIKKNPKDFRFNVHDSKNAIDWLTKIPQKKIIEEYERISKEETLHEQHTVNDIHCTVAFIVTAVYNTIGKEGKYIKRFATLVLISAMKELVFLRCRDCDNLPDQCKRCGHGLGKSLSTCADCGYVTSFEKTEPCKNCGNWEFVDFIINRDGELNMPINVNDMVYNAYKGTGNTLSSILQMSCVVSQIEELNLRKNCEKTP